MAQPQLEQFKKRGLILALRTVAGVAVVPAANTDGVMLINGTSGTEVDKIERDVDRPHFTGKPFVVGGKRAFIEGDFELYPPTAPGGANDSDADCARLLLPAGMTVVKDAVAKTTRYNPVSSGIAIADATWFHAGTVKNVTGCRNNITGLAMTVGDRFKGKVRIQGDYEDVSEDALPTIVMPDRIPVVLRHDNSTTKVKVDGGAQLTLWGKSLSVDVGNTIAAKEYTSHKETGITDRAPTWTVRIAKTALAEFNPWAARDAAKIIEIALRVTESNGLYSELGIRGQIEGVNEVDIDGDYGWELSGPCVASDAGGDEFYIEFGDSSP